MFGTPISYQEAIKKFRFKPKDFQKHIVEYGLLDNPLIGNYGAGYLAEEILHFSTKLFLIKSLWLHHPNKKWYDIFMSTESYNNSLIWQLRDNGDEPFYSNNFEPLILSGDALEKLKALKVTPVASFKTELNPKTILIKIDLLEKGNIRVFCKDCKKGYRDKTGCKHHIDRKKYIARYYNHIEGKEATAWLKSIYRDEAIQEFRDIQTNLYNSGFVNKKTETSLPAISTHLSMMFLCKAIPDFLEEKKNRNENGQIKNENKKAVSSQHLTEMITAFERLKETLKVMGIKPDVFRLDEFNLKLCEELRLKYNELYNLQSASSINKATTHFKALINHINKMYNLNVNNCFKMLHPWREEQKTLKDKNKIFEQKDLFRLVEYVKTNKDKINNFPFHVNKKDLEWLPKAFLFQYYITSRREDVLDARWHDIYFKDIEGKRFWFIKVTNYKKVRLAKTNLYIRDKNLEIYEPSIFPVQPDLKKLFDESGYEKYKNTTDYIIHGELLQNELINTGVLKKMMGRRFMIDVLSNGFTFLVKECFKNEEFDFTLKNKNIKKTNLTNRDEHEGNDIGYHSDISITRKHYQNFSMEEKRAMKNPNIYSESIQ